MIVMEYITVIMMMCFICVQQELSAMVHLQRVFTRKRVIHIYIKRLLCDQRYVTKYVLQLTHSSFNFSSHHKQGGEQNHSRTNEFESKSLHTSSTDQLKIPSTIENVMFLVKTPGSVPFIFQIMVNCCHPELGYYKIRSAE